MKHNYLITLFLLLLLSCCTSVPRLLQQRQFDEAYALAYKLCTRARAPDGKRLEDYLNAYEAIQASELYEAKQLAETRGTAKYAELYARYLGLYTRSLDILEIMPSAAKFDRYPELAPATLEQQKEHARKRAGAHFLLLAETELPAARRGEKPAARRAWAFHQQVRKYLPERNVSFASLRDSLYETGTLRILVYVPAGEGDRELAKGLSGYKPTRRGWTEILPADNGKRIDLEAELRFTDYRDDGVQENCNVREYKEEVLDYIEKKKEKVRINDSTVVEKVVEIKHYKNVYATVTECKQSANVWAYGEVAVYQPGSNTAEWRKKLSSSECWTNTYRYGNGDDRALPAFANSGSAQSPPSLGYMLARATTRLTGSGWSEINRRYKNR